MTGRREETAMIEDRIKVEGIDELIIFYGVTGFALTMRIAEKLLREYDMSLGEYAVLLQLSSRKEEINLSQVKENTYLFSGASITKVAEKLLNKGCITRRENPKSRREKLVKITPAGDKILAKVLRMFRSRYPEVLKGLSPAYKDKFLKELKNIFANVIEIKERT
jgi:DNA-binding MarR family transcriptional regulator